MTPASRDSDAMASVETGTRSGAIAQDRLARHWRRTRRLTAWLLVLWFAVTFCVIFFARALARVTVFDWPLSYYLVAQGAPAFYVVVVGVYAWRMRRIDEDAADAKGPSATMPERKETHAP